VASDAQCGADCVVPFYESTLHSAVRDGQTVKWHVTAVYGTQKVKSPLRTLTADTVNAPTALAPINGTVLASGELVNWNHSPANRSYTLIVKHVASGTTVIKESLLSGECVIYCGKDPYELADLQGGAEYKWFVKATGFNGNKAKSAKYTFTTEFGITD
jgi:hypothetical protein